MASGRLRVGLTPSQILDEATEAYAEIQDAPKAPVLTGQQLLGMTDAFSLGMLKRAAVVNDWNMFNRMLNVADHALRQASYEQRHEMWLILRNQ